jgi:hypothetical protein
MILCSSIELDLDSYVDKKNIIYKVLQAEKLPFLRRLSLKLP